MSEVALGAWLDDLVLSFPERASGEELQRFVVGQCRPILDRERAALVQALEEWIGRREEPRSMLAARLAAELRLGELKEPIHGLLSAVKSGAAFMPQLKDYYVARLEEILRAL
jgi:hypothetical protein